jgi:hypothetical protein
MFLSCPLLTPLPSFVFSPFFRVFCFLYFCSPFSLLVSPRLFTLLFYLFSFLCHSRVLLFHYGLSSFPFLCSFRSLTLFVFTIFLSSSLCVLDTSHSLFQSILYVLLLSLFLLCLLSICAPLSFITSSTFSFCVWLVCRFNQFYLRCGKADFVKLFSVKETVVKKLSN